MSDKTGFLEIKSERVSFLIGVKYNILKIFSNIAHQMYRNNEMHFPKNLLACLS
jgi:hypothetical protein